MPRHASSREHPADAVRPTQEPDKLVMEGVITHRRLIGMIAERNPIVARIQARRADEGRR